MAIRISTPTRRGPFPSHLAQVAVATALTCARDRRVPTGSPVAAKTMGMTEIADVRTNGETSGSKRFRDLGDLVSDYLSERHRADRANGCPIAALGADIARQGAGIRHGLTAHLRAQLNRVAQLLRGGTASSRRKRAIATLAGMVGTLTLARAVDDPTLSTEILAAARDTFGRSAVGGS